jgi:hypothetical protein
MAHHDPFDPTAVSTSHRPKWPTPVAIISIVLAAMGLVCGGLGAASASFFAGMVKDQLNGAPLPPNMVLAPIDYALLFIGFGLAFFLLVSAIVLLRRRYLARPLYIVYALLSLAVNFYGIYLQLDKLAQVKAWAQTYPDNQIAQSMSQPGSQIGNMIGMGIYALLGIGWPLFCILWFALVKTRREQYEVTGPAPAA